MAEKNFKGAPFGVQTARFDVSSIHPKSKTPGTFTQTPYCKKATSPLSSRLGPGCYDVDHGGFSSKAVGERAGGPGWARAYEVSRMASVPHLLHKEQWELKQMLKRKLGPGSYEIKDFLEASDEKPTSTRGVLQTREQRLREKHVSKTPGPGTYGMGGVPHAAMEQKNRQSASTVGVLDAGASSARSLPMVGSHLGPGNYNFKSFTEANERKLTSLRGPYDLFSGDRNKGIKTGHFATPVNSNLGPGQYHIKSFLEEWVDEHKTRHGRFAKVLQYPEKPTERIYSFSLSQNPRKPKSQTRILNSEIGSLITYLTIQNHFISIEPGPGQYDAKSPNVKPPSQSKKSPGFLSSAQRSDKMATKFFTGNFNPVGPGRYDIQKWIEAQHKNGHNSVFRSKTDKPDLEREKYLRERIRSKDMRAEDKVSLIPHERPADHMKRSKTFLEKSNTQVDFSQRRMITVV